MGKKGVTNILVELVVYSNRRPEIATIVEKNVLGHRKCYSQILCGGSVQNFRFGYFVLIWWQSDKKQEILKQTCKDYLFILAELPIVWLIIRSDNIFNIEADGAFAINMIVHNPLTKNWNRLKFWIYASYVNIY